MIVYWILIFFSTANVALGINLHSVIVAIYCYSSEQWQKLLRKVENFTLISVTIIAFKQLKRLKTQRAFLLQLQGLLWQCTMSLVQWMGVFLFLPCFKTYTEKSNRPVVTLQYRSNQSHLNGNRAAKTLFVFDPENEIFFAIIPEIPKSECFVNFVYCLKN